MLINCLEPTLYSPASVDVKEPVCAVEDQYRNDKLFATMVLNDQQVQFQLDSGATVNIHTRRKDIYFTKEK